jgi:hypothetical protein
MVTSKKPAKKKPAAKKPATKKPATKRPTAKKPVARGPVGPAKPVTAGVSFGLEAGYPPGLISFLYNFLHDPTVKDKASSDLEGTMRGDFAITDATLIKAMTNIRDAEGVPKLSGGAYDTLGKGVAAELAAALQGMSRSQAW